LSTQVGGASSWIVYCICMCINMKCCIAKLKFIFMLVWWLLEIELEWWFVESSSTSSI
jgi:hypothetical protein